MVALRFLLAIVTAISVAALPVPAALARIHSSSAAHHAPSSGEMHNTPSSSETHHAANMDCCKGDMPCEKHSGDGCDSMAGCLMKCCSVTSAVASLLSAPLSLADARLGTVADPGIPNGATAPPLPPPRV